MIYNTLGTVSRMGIVFMDNSILEFLFLDQ